MPWNETLWKSGAALLLFTSILTGCQSSQTTPRPTTSVPKIQSTIPVTIEPPPTNMPVTGAIRMNEGDDLVYGPVGQPFQLTVHFSGQSSAGKVTQMREERVKACDLNTTIAGEWENFSPEKQYTIQNLPMGATDFTLNVQYRDDHGNESLIYCGTIGIEGTQSSPTP